MMNMNQLATNITVTPMDDLQIKQLADTDSTAIDPAAIQWFTTEIIRTAYIDGYVLENFIGVVHTSVKGNQANIRQITGMNSGAAMDFDFTEGTGPTMYALDFNDEPILPERRGIGVAITGHAMDIADFDIVRIAMDELARQFRIKRDNVIYDTLIPSGTAIPAGVNEIFAGTDTSIGTGDTWVLDEIPQAKRLIEDDNGKPNRALFIPEDKEFMSTLPQFTEAHRFGDRSVIERGVVNTYLDLDFYYTNNYVPRTAADADFTVNGHDILVADTTRYAHSAVWAGMTMARHDHPQDDKVYIVVNWNEAHAIVEPSMATIIHCANR